MWTAVILLGIALAIVWVVVQSRPSVPVESREAKMRALDIEPASSYAQKTNHFQLPEYSLGQVGGFESPYRVNQYHAYIE